MKMNNDTANSRDLLRGMTVFPSAVIISKVGKFFREKGASASEDAIEVSTMDWIECGLINNEIIENDRLWHAFIKKTEDGKFWFDAQNGMLEAQKIKKEAQRVLLIILIVSVLTLVFLVRFVGVG